MNPTSSAHARMAEDAGELNARERGGGSDSADVPESRVRCESSDVGMEGNKMEGETIREAGGEEEQAEASSSGSDSPEAPASPPPWYDAEMDDRDERWMAKTRRRRGGRRSDAILSCPACLSSVCFDCQRHERFTTQYRAVFAVNCAVNTSQKLVMPSGKDGGSKKRKGRGKSGGAKEQGSTGGGGVGGVIGGEGSAGGEEEVMHPVMCETCGTEVGVFDAMEQVYHFFNVLPTNC
ncbi:unnamed protein product [Closterium sp. NIES-65]|nr:unnamed protein product [Closterium sp. NIES-65]